MCSFFADSCVACQVLPWLLLGGWAALGRDCGELRRRSVTCLGHLGKG